ncbi:hypothetical protein [Pseudarthrobacter sp. SSS035]|uniref:hypothetical protein n=1 Tax=Pseudarthrobacter sp. SSS035 TaxID=2931399 RepID=UPI00200DED7C|nr:hypothetical protein [Pseudarthrobacter sp. SSS035]
MIDQPQLLATITATSKTTMDRDLGAAIEAAEQLACDEGRRGILVRRLGYASYTVELSPDVPYGITYEKQEF